MFNLLRRIPRQLSLPPLTAQQWTVLLLVTLAALWGSYDLAVLQLALPQIAESLRIPLAQLSDVGALIKLGSLPAFGFAVAADRWGRRRLLISSVVCFTLATGATAFAPNVTTFVVCQFLARLFVTVVITLAGVFIIEEFPAHARGWGMGAFTGLATLGGGLAALLFAGIEQLPFGWRGLYVIGLVAFAFLPLWIMRLPETARFQAQQNENKATESGAFARRVQLQVPRWQPLRQLLRAYPLRLRILVVVILLFNLGGDAALFYDPTYLQQAHGWQPWQVSLLNLSAGFMALVGSMVAGRLSDRMGRRRTGGMLLVAMSLCIIAYYNVQGWLLPLFWAGLLFSSIGATVVLSAINNELFPTAYRATASGAIAILATLSGAASLTVHGQLVRWQLSPWTAISLLALGLLVIPVSLMRLPETSGRALEEIAPEA